MRGSASHRCATVGAYAHENYEHLALELGSQGWLVIGPKQRVEQRGSRPHGCCFPGRLLRGGLHV